MDFVLSTDDLAQMPVSLRQNLLNYFSQAVLEQSSQENGVFQSGGYRYETISGGTFDPKRSVVVLNVYQVDELNSKLMQQGRKAANDGDGSDFKAFSILRAFEYENDANAPTAAKLVEIAKLDDPKRLGPYLGSINRILRKMTHNPDASIYWLDPGRGVYVVHPETRKALRERKEALLKDIGVENPPPPPAS